MINLTGKSALVTGASRGIGAATAVLLAQAGARVAITYRARKSDADRVLALLDAGSQRTAHSPHAIQADFSDPESAERAVSEAVEKFGKLDFFIANAGIWPEEDVPLAEMTPERWRETMAINLDAVFYGCRKALQVMEPHGRIVIVSSTAGQRGEAFHADYAATKGAIIALVKSLCIEAAPRDITVNSVAPGWVDTEMSAKPYTASGGRGKGEIERTIPLGRVATPEDVAGPIVFLCSDLARHVTGEILNVNGGAVLMG